MNTLAGVAVTLVIGAVAVLALVGLWQDDEPEGDGRE